MPPNKPIENPRVRIKSNEEIIREELRVSGDAYTKVWQTGMTLLPALMIALFYFRKETAERFSVAGKIAKGDILPIDIYLIGTLFLFVVCAAFCLMLRLIGNRYRFYVTLLGSECDNPLPVPPPMKWSLGRWLFYTTLLAFPVTDVVLFLLYKWRVQINFAASIIGR